MPIVANSGEKRNYLSVFFNPINKNSLPKAGRHNTFLLLERRYGESVKANKKKIIE
jgi:hypothetical protein